MKVILGQDLRTHKSLGILPFLWRAHLVQFLAQFDLAFVRGVTDVVEEAFSARAEYKNNMSKAEKFYESIIT